MSPGAHLRRQFQLEVSLGCLGKIILEELPRAIILPESCEVQCISPSNPLITTSLRLFHQFCPRRLVNVFTCHQVLADQISRAIEPLIY